MSSLAESAPPQARLNRRSRVPSRRRQLTIRWRACLIRRTSYWSAAFLYLSSALTLIQCAGRWLWHGCCEGTICHFGRRKDAQVQGHQRALRHSPGRRKVWAYLLHCSRAGTLTVPVKHPRMPGQCNVLLAEASVPYDSEYCFPARPSCMAWHGIGALTINVACRRRRCQSYSRWTKSTTTSRTRT